MAAIAALPLLFGAAEVGGLAAISPAMRVSFRSCEQIRLGAEEVRDRNTALREAFRQGQLSRRPPTQTFPITREEFARCDRELSHLERIQ